MKDLADEVGSDDFLEKVNSVVDDIGSFLFSMPGEDKSKESRLLGGLLFSSFASHVIYLVNEKIGRETGTDSFTLCDLTDKEKLAAIGKKVSDGQFDPFKEYTGFMFGVLNVGLASLDIKNMEQLLLLKDILLSCKLDFKDLGLVNWTLYGLMEELNEKNLLSDVIFSKKENGSGYTMGIATLR